MTVVVVCALGSLPSFARDHELQLQWAEVQSCVLCVCDNAVIVCSVVSR